MKPSDSSTTPPAGQMDWTRGPEVMWTKWLTPDTETAFNLAASIRELLMGAHKLRFSTLALCGMDVRWEVLQRGPRVWLVIWAEPEGEPR